MVEEPGGAEGVTSEAAAHALMDQPFAFEVRGGLPTVHTSASVKGEQWKQRWQQCMCDVQRGDAVCVEAIQATHMFGGDAYHEAVGTRGGIVAMQANFYAIVNHIVPASDPARMGKVSRLREISVHWGGVCGWQH